MTDTKHYCASEGWHCFIRPTLYTDINIRYNNKWYWGWYDGNELWRLFWEDERKNTLDTYVYTNEIQEWYYLNSL